MMDIVKGKPHDVKEAPAEPEKKAGSGRTSLHKVVPTSKDGPAPFSAVFFGSAPEDRGSGKVPLIPKNDADKDHGSELPGSKDTAPKPVAVAAPRKSMLASVKNRLAGQFTAKGKKGKKVDSNQRIVALMEARKAEFECLPVAERDSLRQAFMRCDHDRSNTLDPREVRKSLAEVGIQGRTPEEKRVITQICRDAVYIEGINFFDFVFSIVPLAKHELNRIRRSALRVKFESCDNDKSGLLSQDECMGVVLEICSQGMDATAAKTFLKDFPPLFQQCQMSDCDDIDFEGFVILLELLDQHQAHIKAEREKHIATSTQLPSHMVLQYRGELISLYEAFENADVDGSCYLERQEVMHLIIEMGLSPADRQGREAVDAILDKLNQYAGIGFYDFLCLVKGVRQDTVLIAHDECKQLFAKYDIDQSGSISFNEASDMMADTGLAMSSAKDKASIRELFEEVDQNGSGDIDADEFYSLMQKVMERLRAEAFHNEHQLSLRLGYSASQVAEMREFFQTLDEEGHGEIGIETLQRIPQHLGIEVSDMAGTLCKLDQNFAGKVDFLLFMKFMSGMEKEKEKEKEKEECQSRTKRPSRHKES